MRFWVLNPVFTRFSVAVDAEFVMCCKARRSLYNFVHSTIIVLDDMKLFFALWHMHHWLYLTSLVSVYKDDLE